VSKDSWFIHSTYRNTEVNNIILVNYLKLIGGMGKTCSNCNCVSLEPCEFNAAPGYRESIRYEPKENTERTKTDTSTRKAPLVEVRI
jgi:hypothetical protein